MSAIVIFDIAGLVAWVIALALMAGGSRMAFRQIPAGVSVPMLWDNKHIVVWRAPRALGLVLTPAIAFLAGVPLLYFAQTAPDVSQAAIWFGIRALLAPVMVMVHMGHLRRAIQTLRAEGRLTP
jgi:hypothetical protein